jgi:hypothetical protein
VAAFAECICGKLVFGVAGKNQVTLMKNGRILNGIIHCVIYNELCIINYLSMKINYYCSVGYLSLLLIILTSNALTFLLLLLQPLCHLRLAAWCYCHPALPKHLLVCFFFFFDLAFFSILHTDGCFSGW